MTLTKSLTVLALTAVVAGSVSTFAMAEGMGGPDHGSMPMMKFEAVDTNKDGKITTEEFDAYRIAEFAATDSNADGQLTAEEIAAKRLAEMTVRANDMATKMIERMDQNGDGQLSADEIAQGPRPVSMFERADANGDGAITKDEVDAMQEKMGKYRKLHRKG